MVAVYCGVYLPAPPFVYGIHHQYYKLTAKVPAIIPYFRQETEEQGMERCLSQPLLLHEFQRSTPGSPAASQWPLRAQELGNSCHLAGAHCHPAEKPDLLPRTEDRYLDRQAPTTVILLTSCITVGS